MKFDLPQVVMKTQTMSLDVPQFTIRDQDFTFSTPSVHLVDRVVGQYPEFHGPFNIVMKDIIISVPEPFMEEQRIIVSIPEVTMATTSISLDIPEVTMETVEWILQVPEVRMGDITLGIPVDASDLKAKAATLKEEGAQLTQDMQARAAVIKTEATQLAQNTQVQQYAQQVSSVSGSADADIMKKFDDAIASIDAALAQSAHMPAAQIAALTAQRDMLQAAKAKAHSVLLPSLTASVERSQNEMTAMTRDAQQVAVV
jgi:hypothetical protein